MKKFSYVIPDIDQSPRLILFGTYDGNVYRTLHIGPLVKSWAEFKQTLGKEPYKSYTGYLGIQACIPGGARQFIYPRENLEELVFQESLRNDLLQFVQCQSI